jgi:hypothetical protein
MRAEPAASSGASTASSASGAAWSEGRVDYREVTLPAGTVLPLTLETTVASNSSRVEDRVQARLRRDVVVNGRTVLPAGTPVRGIVTEARESGRVKGRGRIGVRFTSLAAHDESYRLRTASIVREAPGTKKKDAATIGIPAGAGALIGGLAGGKKGAAIGAAAGGGGGTAVVLSTRGKAARLGRGAALSARLVEPLTVRVPRF